MHASLPLITTLVLAFGLALLFGFLAERFGRAPALVGFLLAGVFAGSNTPGPSADLALAHQLSEIGVMLLMFGVGLHFSVRDLMSVKGVAIPGAVGQMAVATLIGAVAAHWIWDWPWGQAIVFGISLSCASTVVLIKALEVRKLLDSHDGRLAMGWLVVEDVATVLILVLLPPLSGLLGGGSEAMTGKSLAVEILITFLNVAAFTAVMFVVGRRVLPAMLTQVAKTGSRELFTLFVLACALGVAYGAAVIFHVSFALGAFFAGMVMRESKFAHRAATESIPLQDAFAVLFFVGVGMLFDWHILIDAPGQVLLALLVVLLGKSIAAFAIVIALKRPLRTALTVAASLAQIGEFSFILVGEAVALGMATPHTVNLIVGAAILSIALNPVFFWLAPRVEARLAARYAWARKAALREDPNETLDVDGESERLRAPIVALCRDARGVAQVRAWHEAGLPVVALAADADAEQLKSAGVPAVAGAIDNTTALVQAHAYKASLVVIFADGHEALAVINAVRQVNADVHLLVVCSDAGVWDEVPESQKAGVEVVTVEGLAAEKLGRVVTERFMGPVAPEAAH